MAYNFYVIKGKKLIQANGRTLQKSSNKNDKR